MSVSRRGDYEIRNRHVKATLKAGVMMNEIYERCEKDPAFSVVQSERGTERQHEAC